MAEYDYGMHPWKRKKNGKGQSCLKHRVVWMKHFGEIPKDHVIHHINGDKFDNRIENLECLTRSEHAFKHRKPFRKRIKYPSGAIKVVKEIMPSEALSTHNSEVSEKSS